eukprot:9187758-Prorocentrum_lima.AAC.1
MTALMIISIPRHSTQPSSYGRLGSQSASMDTAMQAIVQALTQSSIFVTGVDHSSLAPDHRFS